MDRKELEKLLLAEVKKYVGNDSAYEDDSLLEIDPATWHLAIVASDTAEASCDYYDIMDLVEMSVDNPGQWQPCEEAIAEVAAEYFPA